MSDQVEREHPSETGQDRKETMLDIRILIIQWLRFSVSVMGVSAFSPGRQIAGAF